MVQLHLSLSTARRMRSSGDAVISSCFVSHLREAARRHQENMCVLSACTLRQHLKHEHLEFRYWVEPGLSPRAMSRLQGLADSVEVVQPVEWPRSNRARPPLEREYSFHKLHLWNLTAFARILYFDPDVIWSADAARYFERYGHAPRVAIAEFNGSLVPRWWRDQRLRYINSGLLLLRPSQKEWASLMSRWAAHDYLSMPEVKTSSRVGGLAARRKTSEQDVLRAHFADGDGSRFTPMDQCDNFRGYVKATRLANSRRHEAGGQPSCDPAQVIAWHGMRFGSKASKQCRKLAGVTVPPLTRSLQDWERMWEWRRHTPTKLRGGRSLA